MVFFLERKHNLMHFKEDIFFETKNTITTFRIKYILGLEMLTCYHAYGMFTPRSHVFLLFPPIYLRRIFDTLVRLHASSLNQTIIKLRTIYFYCTRAIHKNDKIIPFLSTLYNIIIHCRHIVQDLIKNFLRTKLSRTPHKPYTRAPDFVVIYIHLHVYKYNGALTPPNKPHSTYPISSDFYSVISAAVVR
jgi:hypothetical protein